MFFWYVGAAILIIWFVFTDPNFDYRLLPVGAALPGLIELPTGDALVLHSLTVWAVLLALIMLITRRHSPRRRLWIGFALGGLLYLVLSGAWADGAVFWWPFFGVELGDTLHPIIARRWWNVPMEFAGMVMCWWIWRTAGLSRSDRRTEFLQTGKLHLPVR